MTDAEDILQSLQECNLLAYKKDMEIDKMQSQIKQLQEDLAQRDARIKEMNMKISKVYLNMHRCFASIQGKDIAGDILKHLRLHEAIMDNRVDPTTEDAKSISPKDIPSGLFPSNNPILFPVNPYDAMKAKNIAVSGYGWCTNLPK